MSRIKTLLDFNIAATQALIDLAKKRPGLSLTVAYVVLVFVFRGVDFLRLLRNGPSGELGDFLAGVFTPVALGWLIGGYFLQREELRAQREELGLQREELARTGDALQEQTAIERERRENERQKERPRFTLEKEGQAQNDLIFGLRNDGGGNAHNVKMNYGPVIGEQKMIIENLMRPGHKISFTIPIDKPYHAYSCEVLFFTENKIPNFQEWEIDLSGRDSSFPIILEKKRAE